MSTLDLAAARAVIEKAHGHVFDLCEGRTKWTMRIPADEQRDSDLVISAGLKAGDDALTEVEQLRSLAGHALDGIHHYHAPIPVRECRAPICVDLLAARDGDV